MQRRAADCQMDFKKVVDPAWFVLTTEREEYTLIIEPTMVAKGLLFLRLVGGSEYSTA